MGASSPALTGLPSLSDIDAAAERIRSATVRTPTVRSLLLERELGSPLWMKMENLQVTASFKVRGALNKLLSLSQEERDAGVIACSAGNHAQGVAYHANRLSIPATIVMPSRTPFSKVTRTEALGAKVVLSGADLAESQDRANELVAEHGYTFIHPYDDPLIIAGQGTIAREIFEDAPEIDTIVVPIGGGGLISGIAIAARALRPDIKIYGVEVALYPSMYENVKGPAPDNSDRHVRGIQTLAEGIAVKRPGALTSEAVREFVDDILIVGESQIETAVQKLVEIQKVVAEGSGAAALAAVLSFSDLFKGRNTALLTCGGNIDSRLLASVLLRGLARDGRMARIRVAITDQPGTLGHVGSIVGQAGGNIIDIVHQRLFHDMPVKSADLDIAVETKSSEHIAEIMEALAAAGYPGRLLTELSNQG